MNLIHDPGSWQSFQHKHANSGKSILDIKRMYLIEQAQFYEQAMQVQSALAMAEGNGGGQPIGVIGPVETTTTSTTTTTTTEEPTTTTSTTTTTTTEEPTTTTSTTTTTTTEEPTTTTSTTTTTTTET